MHRESEDDDAEKNDEETEEKEGSVDEKKEEEEEEEEEVDPRDLLTKEQLQYFRDIFDSFDVNKKEKIPAKTIGFVLRLMGLNPTKADIKRHIMEIDPGNKGLIDFQSFLLPIAQKIDQEAETHEDIIAAFKIFDESKEGNEGEEGEEFVYTDQLIEYLTTLGEDLEDFEIELLMKMADPKGTGKIHYVEFVEKMMGIVRKSPKKKGEKGGKKGNKK